MATYLFQKLSTKAGKEEVDLTSEEESTSWFRDAAKKISAKSLNIKQFVKSDQERLLNATKINKLLIGRMILFTYDPKLKETLPYYDTHPLVFPVELYSDGFLGLNMHYLSPVLRARLMDALYTTINNNLNNDKTRLKLSYELLSGASKFRFYKPCLKKYLYTNITSRLFVVDINEWDMTLMLPLQQFVGAPVSEVYKNSQEIINKS